MNLSNSRNNPFLQKSFLVSTIFCIAVSDGPYNKFVFMCNLLLLKDVVKTDVSIKYSDET
jgi:hypothetical protein